MSQALTVAERILYHLFQYVKSEDKYESPFDVTQDGIAQSCGISRAHAAIELKKLKESDQIVERLSHVRRARSRRKVYFLTKDGKTKAAKIADHVSSQEVETGVDPSRIAQGTGPAKRVKRYISAIPQPKQFFGREEELGALGKSADEDSTELISITGLGGIGKTTLLAKFARESKMSIFWFSLNEWETEISLFKALSNFLEETGDDHLSNYLRSDRIDLGEISYLLSEALSDNRRILIFDDVDKAPRLHNFIKMIIQSAGPNKIVISSEKRIALIDEIASLGKAVKEMTIEGLGADAAMELLRTRGVYEKKADALCKLTGNHPLMLEMVPINDEQLARTEMTNFVKKTLLREISSIEMRAIESCSILRRPFSLSYLSKDARNVVQLPIFYAISDNFALHEMIRKIIEDQIEESDAIDFHSKAADYYLSEKNLPERLYHLVQSGRFIESEIMIHSRSDELLSSESPKNLLQEIEMIPARVSKYASSVRILAAKASSLLGDEKIAIDSLLEISKIENGDNQINALLELTSKNLDKRMRKRVCSQLENNLKNEILSCELRSKIALSLATMKFADNDLSESEGLATEGLTMAANTFSVETISALNRLLAKVLASKQDYSDSISFLSKTAPSFSGKHQPEYQKLLAEALLKAGKPEDAARSLETGIKISEKNGFLKELAESLLEYSSVKISLKDLDVAAESCYRCIEVSSSLGDGRYISQAYSRLAEIESERGNDKEAEEHLKMAKKLEKEF